jgi:hypothetical protein
MIHTIRRQDYRESSPPAKRTNQCNPVTIPPDRALQTKLARCLQGTAKAQKSSLGVFGALQIEKFPMRRRGAAAACNDIAGFRIAKNSRTWSRVVQAAGCPCTWPNGNGMRFLTSCGLLLYRLTTSPLEIILREQCAAAYPTIRGDLSPFEYDRITRNSYE